MAKMSAKERYERLMLEAEDLQIEMALEALTLGTYREVQIIFRHDGWQVTIEHPDAINTSTSIVRSEAPSEVMEVVEDILVRLAGKSDRPITLTTYLTSIDGRPTLTLCPNKTD